MLSTAAYLNKTYKVAEIRALAKLIGLKGVAISRTRKAELIDYIVGMIDFDHDVAEYMRATEVKPRTPKYTISLMDYPVPYGRPVTEQHTRICADRGHVSYVKDGIDTGICPRCGEVTTSEEQITMVPDSEEKEIPADMTLDAFLSRALSALEPLQIYAAKTETDAWHADNPEAEQWTTVSKDLTNALANIEWMLNYRNPSQLYS